MAVGHTPFNAFFMVHVSYISINVHEHTYPDFDGTYRRSTLCPRRSAHVLRR